MRIAVAGAGLAGLTAALRLQQAGHEVEVFEAEGHPGGRLWSVAAGDFQLDVGTHMLLECYDRTRALVTELGLGDRWYRLESPDEGGILHGDQVTSFSPRKAFDVLRYRGLHLRGRIRLFLALAEAYRWRDDLDFFDLSAGDDALDDEDCRTFGIRRLGLEATDYVLDSFIRTFHFHGADRMSRKYFEALAVLLATRGEFRPCALRGNMRVLPEALAAQLSMHYDSPVHEVQAADTGVTLRVGHSTKSFDAVVVASTASAARAMLSQPSPAHTAVLTHAAYSSTATCAFSLPLDVAGAFEGIWVPYVESKIISGLSNETSKGASHTGRCLFTVWLHEEATASLLDLPDAELLEHVTQELQRLFPKYAGHAEALHVQRWPAALPIYGPGQISEVRKFWESGQGTDNIWLCGDYLNHPWLEGAVRCGERVAALIGP